eukprot:GHVN01095805.1.p1 GENE.GHVN01095805.1~~GHVN01095805.1.p1  ORF type:complete len:263 (+),score=26.25 GHVN01095805.1:29-790(+)
MYEGLHTGPPGFEFIIFPSVFKTFTFTDLRCLNLDGVTTYLSVSYQFKVRADTLRGLIQQFRNDGNYQAILYNLGESALHDSCSQFNTSQFQSERGIFQEDLRTRLVNKYDQIDCDVTDLQVNDIKRPREYENAIKAKEAAREDIEVAHQERPKALTEANTKKREAETTAEITINKANSEARIKLNQAGSDAAAILNEYEKEAATYKALVSAEGLDLDAEGFLSYMGIRTIQEAQRTVLASMPAPAKASYVTP